jgi:hydroxypyruvate reductase
MPPLSDDARNIFVEAMARSTVGAAMQASVRMNEGVLHAGPHTLPLASSQPVAIVAVGKAGATMFDAFLAALPATQPVSAVVSAPFAPQAPCEFLAGGHPEPNAASLAAAHAALRMLRDCSPEALVVFLISGGASAMMELPLDASIPLAEVQAFHRALVASGAPITALNCIRKHLSAVKGGRLAVAAKGRRTLTLLVSDVPAGALDALGSGPSLPDTTTAAECLQSLADFDLQSKLPPGYQRAIAAGMEETPKPGDTAFAHSSTHVLLGNETVLAAATESARTRGYAVTVDNSCDDTDYGDAARYLFERAQHLQRTQPRGCLLSGGEVTVRLPQDPGQGGRNQQWALRLALEPGFTASGITALSAGTDGIDGVSPAAGAVVDSTTLARAEEHSLSLANHLQRFDAYPAFAKLGDAITLGPTGNNLRDVRLLLWDTRSERMS